MYNKIVTADTYTNKKERERERKRKKKENAQQL